MKRFSKNFISIIGSDIARRILGFLTIAYLARKVGTSQFGAINIGFTVLSYAIIFSTFGLSSFGIRAVAKNEIAGLVNRIISIRLMMALIAFMGIVTITYIISLDADTSNLIIVFCLSLFPFAFLLDWFFQGKERMGIIGLGRLISASIYLILIFIFVRSSEDILWVAIASVVGELTASFILWIFYKKIFQSKRFKFSISKWKSLIKQSFSLGFGSILGSFSVNLPPIMLGIILTNSDVGIYSAASKLVFFLLMFDRVIATLLLPASSRLFASSAEALESALNKALKWIVIIALPICVGGVILGDEIMLIVFGTQYTQAVDIFRILIWYLLFTMLHTVYASGLIAIGKEKIFGAVMFISMIIHLFSIVICIKYFGVAGAAAAMVVSELATFVIMRQRLQLFNKVCLPRTMFQIIVSVIIMGCVVVLLKDLNVFFIILAGMVVYLISLFTTKALSFHEVDDLLKRI
ncbi:MAG: flippase [Bacteroidota bacterium]|nr:flippase [Bacteroidota bacterium]